MGSHVILCSLPRLAFLSPRQSTSHIQSTNWTVFSPYITSLFLIKKNYIITHPSPPPSLLIFEGKLSYKFHCSNDDDDETFGQVVYFLFAFLQTFMCYYVGHVIFYVLLCGSCSCDWYIGIDSGMQVLNQLLLENMVLE